MDGFSDGKGIFESSAGQDTARLPVSAAGGADENGCCDGTDTGISVQRKHSLRTGIPVFLRIISLAACALLIRTLYIGSPDMPGKILSSVLPGGFSDSDGADAGLYERMVMVYFGRGRSNAEVFVPDTPASSGAEETNAPAAAVKTTAELLAELYTFDESAIPGNEYPIIPMDLSREADGVLRLSNETDYTPDLEALKNEEPSIGAFASLSDTAASDAPVVLIIHTHGTEAFSKEGAVSYTDTYNVPRSSDITENIVAVGAVMAQVFESSGIPTIHCEIMHDLESYKDSYNRAAETIEYYLAEYPSIKYVFDVHRDSLILSDKSKVRPVTVTNGLATAQVMCVVGTDAKGGYHPGWMTNLRLAVKLQSSLNSSYTGLARSIYLRGATFNEEYTSGSLLLEIGSCGNTLAEAERAGEIVAEKLAALIKNGW